MRRRKVLGSIAAAGTLAVAGCTSGTKDETFRLDDLGLVERNENVAAYANITNVGSKEAIFTAFLAPYDTNGVRLDEWQYIASGRDSPIRPGRTVAFYAAYNAGESHWFDSNDIGQVVNANTARLRVANKDVEPIGRDYTTEDIGTVLENPNADDGWP